MAIGEITIKQEFRTCFANGKKAFFHRWLKKTDLAFSSEYCTGLVEYENGKVDEVRSEKIKFCDGKMKEYCFPEERKSNIIKILKK